MDVPPSLKRALRRHGLEGALRPIAAPLYAAAVAQELWLERVLDAASGPTRDRSTPELTALIKTFERPRVLRRLIASLRRLYRDLPTLVVDDSREPTRLDGVRTVAMPFDSGVSAGRNEGLRHVETKYVLLLDDDFVVYRHTRLPQALSLMEKHPEIDIMGGEVVDLPFFRAQGMREGGLFPTPRTATRPLGSAIGGLTVCATVPNFFLARVDRLALVPWEPRLKRMEHADFFTRAHGVLTTVFNKALKCLHAPTPFDSAYMRKRMDLEEASRFLAERYGGVR